MIPNDITSFCDRWLAAWTGNKPDQLLSFYDKNAFYRDPAYPQGLTGHEALLPYFQKLLAKNPHWIWKAVEIFPTEKGFVFKWEASIPIEEKVLTEYGMDMVELKNGKITRNEVYFDPRGMSRT